MTALELADWIENGAPFGKYETAKQAVVMLRQQQAEIANLKAGLFSHHDIYPVKELTDEEIWKCHDETDSDNWVIDFARAILRKASEK